MGIRVLFIYPNTYGMNMLPPAIALFSALLKDRGHSVDLFDATYYQTDHGIDSDGTKAERLNVVPFSTSEKGIKMRDTNWSDDIKVKVKIFDKYKLDDIVQAHKDLEARKIIGPAVIVP